MKVVLVYLIRGEAQKYQKKLIKEIAEVSGERHLAYDNPIPEHMTLRSPFNLDNLDSLDGILEKFTKKIRPASIQINGFGSFDKSIEFLRIEIPQKVRYIQNNLIKQLGDELSIQPHDYDYKWHPHATIAKCNSAKSFVNAENYLKNQKNPEFNLMFDNITILIKPKKLWEVHKTYNLK